jgi:hypothetical protein
LADALHASTHKDGGAATAVAAVIMPRKRGTHDWAVASQASLGILSILDKKSLVEVLCAAKEARLLGRLASTSKQLCTLARSSVPCYMTIYGPLQAQLLLRSHAHGRPPFSGCTRLHFTARDLGSCLLAAGVLNTVQPWTSLQGLGLHIELKAGELGSNQTVDFCVSSVLSALPSLQQLRSLELRLPELGPCSAANIGQLVQLTCLDLTVSRPALAAEEGAAAEAAGGNRLDLGSWSRLTNLKRLEVKWAPAVQPAAAATGPFCLPSSLEVLIFGYETDPHPEALACWLTHVPGCPQLQEVGVNYGPQQHASTHPRVLVRLLAQHTPRLRDLQFWREAEVPPDWGAAVAGLPDAAGPVEGEWHPGPALAALRGLEVLCGDRLLTIEGEPHWQDLAQLTALTALLWTHIHYAPPLRAGATLGVLELDGCHIHLGGRGLGRLLLACPQLETADLILTAPLVSTPVGPSESPLQPHPSLKTFQLRNCHSWGSAAPTAAAAAPAAVAAVGVKAHFGALAPVLRGVLHLELHSWPAGSSSSPAVGTLPDLSNGTSLKKLVFVCHEGHPDQAQPEQEQFLSMVGALGGKLQGLEVRHAPRLNARVALVLQSLLPQLQRVVLNSCGAQLPLMPAGSTRQQVQQALDGVMQLLRPGLQLHAFGD